MQKMWTQWNQQLIWYVFSKVYNRIIEKIKPSNEYKTFENKFIKKNHLRQDSWVQNIRIKVRKYEAVECLEMLVR